MKIGLFSDTYHPSSNGVVYVVDIIYDNLTTLGHDVTIIAPRPGLRSRHGKQLKNRHILWVPAIKGLFFDEYLTSVFSPTLTIKKIDKLKLDIIYLFTPAQMGLLGAYYAKINHLPLVEQYSTDLVAYIKQYPNVIFGVLALIFVAIFSINIKLKDAASITTKLIGINKTKNLNWSQTNTQQLLKIFHNNMNLVIAVSKKVQQQLLKDNVTSKIKVIPTGVDPLKGSIDEVNIFRNKHKIHKNDIIILYAGRLSIEKNLDLLLDSFILLAQKYNNLKLIFAGDFNYKKQLQQKALNSKFDKEIIFLGKVDRNDLGSIYMSADIFAFPSLTDTQALVLNEAANAGLPIVWCDKNVNEVVVEGKNGVLAKNNIKSFAQSLERLIKDPIMRKKFSNFSKKNSCKFSEKDMAQKLNNCLVDLIED